MKRSKFPMTVPDVISVHTNDYSIISNNILRNSDLSSKAKVILTISLNNKEGWKSYKVSLCNWMKEGVGAIEKALKELQIAGYLDRIKYNDKHGKIRGSVWIVTDIPGIFDLLKLQKILSTTGFHINEKTISLKTILWKTILSKSDPNNININKIKKENISELKVPISLKTKKIKNNPYSRFTKQLFSILKKHNKITRASTPNNWTIDFMKLHEIDGVSCKRIKEILEWYAKNIGGMFIPECYSGRAFRAKFEKLEAAIARSNKGSQQYSSKHRRDEDFDL